METGALGETGSRLCSASRGNYHRLRRMRAKLRIVSNVGLIIGQCVLLFVSRDLGLIIIITSSILSVPFFLHAKMWDVIALMLFLNIINFIGLFLQ